MVMHAGGNGGGNGGAAGLAISHPVKAVAPAEHLLKVASSITRDAEKTWAEIWGQFRPHVTAAGTVLPGLEEGFVPACGWSEFLENFWLLKHYLDSIQRVCADEH